VRLPWHHPDFISACIIVFHIPFSRLSSGSSRPLEIMLPIPAAPHGLFNKIAFSALPACEKTQPYIVAIVYIRHIVFRLSFPV